jgi:hypothetical protein
MEKTFTQQILDALEEGVKLHGSAYKLAKESHVQLSTLGRWLDGTAPRLSAVEPVMDCLRAKVVLPGQSVRDYVRLLQVHAIDASRHADDIRKEQNVPIDMLEYVGNKMHHRPELLFSLDLLQKIGVDAHDALLFTPDSDVMRPVVGRGDQVLIDKTRTTIEDGKIYLIHTGEYFLLRRISRELNGDLILQAETSVPNMTITPELRPRINLLGEVVWVGKKL